jgi:hypothetical protein
VKVFTKVLEKIQNNLLNGHALANIENRKSLVIANKEIEEMMKCVKK